MNHASTPPPDTPLRQLELRCPPLPQTLVEALDLLDNPDQIEVKIVTRLVERDPGVVARLLQVVNSAYYGMRREISSARQAVTLLGPISVAGIVVSMNMLKLHGTLSASAEACFARLIRHSAATAFITRHLITRSRHATPRVALNDAFTAGLLHDFGKIILVYNFRDAAVALYNAEAQSGETQVECTAPADLHAAEQRLFGCDHAEAGAYAARKMRLPGTLADLIRYHHTPDALTLDPGTATLLRIVAAANCAAKAMGHAFVHPCDWSACERDPAWAHLVEHEFPDYDTPAALAQEIQGQRAHVDEYVRNLAPRRVAAASPPRTPS